MFDSFARGFKMIWASILMANRDKRLLVPSILTVFTNFFFAGALFLDAKGGVSSGASGMARQAGSMIRDGQAGQLMNLGGVNGPMDPSGFGAMGGMFNSDILSLGACIVAVWWLTNKFLEGVTTALVYSHLTEGPGAGKFSIACQAVFSSLPAIVILGTVTMIAKRICGWMRDKRGSGAFGFGINFLAQVVEIFWTLAGHLILPSIVIEGTSFWGALKRADRIAQGNLLTIGVGEVGVDTICAVATNGMGLVGVLGFFGIVYAQAQHIMIPMGLIAFVGAIWICSVVVAIAASIYIRAAFYTCLYVWAIEAEAVEEAERHQVNAPAPLAAALA